MTAIEIKLQLAQESIKLQRHSDLKRKYLLFIFTFKHASTFTAHCPLVNAHTDGLPAYLKTCTNRHKCCESPKYGHKILSRRAGGRAGGSVAGPISASPTRLQKPHSDILSGERVENEKLVAKESHWCVGGRPDDRRIAVVRDSIAGLHCVFTVQKPGLSTLGTGDVPRGLDST